MKKNVIVPYQIDSRQNEELSKEELLNLLGFALQLGKKQKKMIMLQIDLINALKNNLADYKRTIEIYKNMAVKSNQQIKVLNQQIKTQNEQFTKLLGCYRS